MAAIQNEFEIKEIRVGGELHCEDDTPAWTEFYKNGQVKSEKYYIHNKVSRTNGMPAIIEYYESGKLQSLVYIVNNVANRNDGPAIIEYYENGNIKTEFYVLNGKYHRDGDLPAHFEYYENGDVAEINYFKNGKMHRCGLSPAHITYRQGYKTFEAKANLVDWGNMYETTKTYFLNGKQSRDCAPSHIEFDEFHNEKKAITLYNGMVSEILEYTDKGWVQSTYEDGVLINSEILTYIPIL